MSNSGPGIMPQKVGKTREKKADENFLNKNIKS